MAVDKLVDSTQLDTDLATVANAIRTKGGTSAQLAFPGGFVSAVQAIPTGITPTGTKQISITENGTTTEDVTNFASAEITVDVQGVIVYQTPQSGYLYTPDYTQTVTINSWETNDTVPRRRAFAGATELVNYRLIVPSGQTVPFDNARWGFFHSCSKLETVWLDAKMGYLTGASMFYGCSSLKSVTIGNINKPFAANDILANRFEGNSSIETVTFYVNAETMEDVPANLINRQPFGAPNATIIYRNSTTGEVITA